MTMFEGISRAWDDVRFWQQIEGDAKRTIVVHPDQADDVRAAVTAVGLDGIVTVLASPITEHGNAYVIDEQAIEAGQRQDLHMAMRRGLW